MKKIFLKCLIGMFFVSIMLIGCGNDEDHYTFKGESYNWLASYVISKSPKEDYYIGKWSLVYIGENKPKNDKVKYTLKGNSLDIEATDKINGQLEGSTTTYFYSKDEEITVVIEWDNYKETINIKTE